MRDAASSHCVQGEGRTSASVASWRPWGGAPALQAAAIALLLALASSGLQAVGARAWLDRGQAGLYIIVALAALLVSAARLSLWQLRCQDAYVQLQTTSGKLLHTALLAWVSLQHAVRAQNPEALSQGAQDAAAEHQRRLRRRLLHTFSLVHATALAGLNPLATFSHGGEPLSPSSAASPGGRPSHGLSGPKSQRAGGGQTHARSGASSASIVRRSGSHVRSTTSLSRDASEEHLEVFCGLSDSEAQLLGAQLHATSGGSSMHVDVAIMPSDGDPVAPLPTSARLPAALAWLITEVASCKPATAGAPAGPLPLSDALLRDLSDAFAAYERCRPVLLTDIVQPLGTVSLLLFLLAAAATPIVCAALASHMAAAATASFLLSFALALLHVAGAASASGPPLTTPAAAAGLCRLHADFNARLRGAIAAEFGGRADPASWTAFQALHHPHGNSRHSPSVAPVAILPADDPAHTGPWPPSSTPAAFKTPGSARQKQSAVASQPGTQPGRRLRQSPDRGQGIAGTTSSRHPQQQVGPAQQQLAECHMSDPPTTAATQGPAAARVAGSSDRLTRHTTSQPHTQPQQWHDAAPSQQAHAHPDPVPNTQPGQQGSTGQNRRRPSPLSHVVHQTSVHPPAGGKQAPTQSGASHAAWQVRGRVGLAKQASDVSRGGQSGSSPEDTRPLLDGHVSQGASSSGNGSAAFSRMKLGYEHGSQRQHAAAAQRIGPTAPTPLDGGTGGTSASECLRVAVASAVVAADGATGGQASAASRDFGEETQSTTGSQSAPLAVPSHLAPINVRPVPSMSNRAAAAQEARAEPFDPDKEYRPDVAKQIASNRAYWHQVDQRRKSMGRHSKNFRSTSPPQRGSRGGSLRRDGLRGRAAQEEGGLLAHG